MTMWAAKASPKEADIVNATSAFWFLSALISFTKIPTVSCPEDDVSPRIRLSRHWVEESKVAIN